MTELPRWIGVEGQAFKVAAPFAAATAADERAAPEHFTPRVEVTGSPGAYSVRATLTVPDSCWSGGEMVEGFPKGKDESRQVVGLILPLKRSDAPCAQGETELVAEYPKLKASGGRKTVKVYVLKGEKVVGEGAGPIP